MTGHRCVLERDAELAELRAACDAAAAGAGGVVAIRAAAGMGKTTLIGETRRLASEAGLDVLEASATELERDLAFGVVRRLFERCTRELVEAGDSSVSDGASALALPVVLDAPAPGPLPPESAHAAMHALYWLAVRLAARQPLLLIVDDAHWADAPSLRWLAYLGRRLEGVPVLVVLADRPSEPGTVGGLLEQVLDEAWARILEPRALGPDAVARWIDCVYEVPAAPEFVAACATVTGGAPFLLRELLTTLRADGIGPGADAAPAVEAITPRSIGRSILVRLARLGEDAVAIAEAAAVLSSDARPDRVAAVARVPAERTGELVARLVDAAVLAPGEMVCFRHPLLRGAVYAQMPPARRDLAHAHAARRMLVDGGGVERASTHLLFTSPAARAWVVETLEAAADAALRRGAPDAAVTLLRRAVDEGPADRGRVLNALTGALFTAGELADAAACGREALAAASRPDQRVAAALAAALALSRHGCIDDALGVVAAVEADAAQLGEETVLEHRATALAMRSWRDGVAGLAEDLTQLDVAGLDGATPGERVLLSLLAMEEVTSGRPRERAAALGRRIIEREDLGRVHADHPVLTAARCLAIAGELDEATAVLDAVIDGARARGDLAALALALGMRGESALWAGDLGAAEVDVAEGLHLDPRPGPWLVAVLAARAALIHLERGRVDSARAALEEHDLLGPVPRLYPMNVVLHARARVHAAIGDLAAAAADLRECGARQDAWGERNPATLPWRSDLALALHGLGGREEEMSALVDDELSLARCFGEPRAIGVALRAAALVAQGDAQIAELRAAVDVLAGGAGRLELARARVDLGAALRRAGRRVEARDTLTTALDEADRCGAQALTDRARDELRAAGARPRRERLSGVEALTASERRVALAAARGLSNREIAQALFVTTKTVEMHLGRTYAKLGISGRADLPAALGVVAR